MPMPIGGRLIPPALLFAVPTVEVESAVADSVVSSEVVVAIGVLPEDGVVVGSAVVDAVGVVSGDDIVVVSAVVEGAFGALEEVIRSRLGFLVGLKIGVVTVSSDSCNSSDSIDSITSSDSLDSGVSSDSVDSCDSSASTDSSDSSESESTGILEMKGALSSDSR